MTAEDLKPSLANTSSPSILLAEAWATSSKNSVARGYMAGLIDALRYTKAISIGDYDNFYRQYVIGGA